MTMTASLATLWGLLVVAVGDQGITAAIPKPSIFQSGIAFPNRPFTLHCSLPSAETLGIVFIWYKDETEVKVQRKSVLEFPSVTQADQGFYTCQASDGDPQTTSPTSDPVAVYPHELPTCNNCRCGGCAIPAVKPNKNSPNDLRAATMHREQRRKRSRMVPIPTIFQQDVPICGRPFTLECVVLEGYGINSRTRYTWYKNSVEIKGQSGILLKIAILKEEDAGEYICTAREGPVETTSPPSQPYHLNPLVPPVVHIEPSSLNSTVKGILGKDLTLTCNVTKAIPWVAENGYSWNFLPSLEEPSLPMKGNARTLTLGPLTRKDSGQYSCTASSGEYFKDPLDLKGHASINVEVVYLENISLSSHEEVVEGDHVTLTCKVGSHPTARLTWFINGRETRHVTDNLDHYVILSASCADSGHYTCHASNAALPGLERNATTKLHVRCNTDTTVSETTQTPVDKEPLPTDQGETTKWTAIVIVETVVIVLLCASFVIIGVLHCRLLGFEIGALLHKWLGLFRSARRDPAQKISKNKRLTNQHTKDEEHVILMSSGEEPGTTRRRKTAGTKGSQEKLKPRFEGTNTRLLQRQRVQFDKTYKKGVVYVIPPPVSESTTQQQPVKDNIVEQKDENKEDEKLKEEKAKTCIVKLLHKLLQEVTRSDDPPVFIFTHALPDERNIVIYHKAYGVIVVHVDGMSNPGSSPFLNKTEELAKEIRDKTKEDIRCLLVPEVIVLLAMPNVRNHRNASTDIVELHDNADVQLLHKGRADPSSHKTSEKPDVQCLYGTDADDYKDWLKEQNVGPDGNAWRRDPDVQEPFEKAVCRYLRVKIFRDSTTGVEISPDSPSGCLVTLEQTAVLHSTDRLIHLWGPPGSGKTTLLVDRARQWLREGKNVIMVVGNPRFELLLDTMGRWALHGKSCDKAKKLMLCRDAGKFKEAVRVWQQESEDTCAVLDEVDEDFLHTALDFVETKKISFLWTARREDLTSAEAEGFEKMNGHRIMLEHSIQCSYFVVELAKILEDGLPPPNIEVHPAAQNFGTHPIKAVRHDSHARDATFGPPPSRLRPLQSFVNRLFSRFSADFVCTDCDEWLRSSLSPIVEDDDWRRWVILLTGDWGSNTTLTGKLVDWLRRQSVPAVLEWQPDNETSNLHVTSILGLEQDQKSGAPSDRGATRARVAASEDKEGAPAVHVIHASYFRGLDKPYVLVVHYDWRDDHPDHQTQQRRDSRLLQHREQLFRAVTRCQQELAVCFLSPSPAASLLPQLQQ